ncbi:hypothetical protein PVOR_10069 [Paenibacillus vortex V453]|uniref:Uncharacterized protein n=1 Tax=Paenibacillus vortex V453 TaxID=715225 RepID=A0A2R9SX37_9BACL|nr:hypothetical protein PVOR_10069 [Paenibacillus vortex V453]
MHHVLIPTRLLLRLSKHLVGGTQLIDKSNQSPNDENRESGKQQDDQSYFLSYRFTVHFISSGRG